MNGYSTIFCIILIIGLSYCQQCNVLIPKSYVAFHLLEGEKIEIDGKLDEDAWNKVAWTVDFQDIQGTRFPTPRFKTHAKLRWDDVYLYVGAFLEENQIWANQTEHDSLIYMDNDFEVFVDPDASNHYYKEIEINAINTVWDLTLNKPYVNGGVANSSWESNMKSAIYVEGKVNDPSADNKYWTVEMAIPFKTLIEQTSFATAPPKKDNQWRINLMRVEWQVVVVNGRYQKIEGLDSDYWVWTPQTFSDWKGGLNMHLPERFGFIQFATGPINQTNFIYPADWHVRIVLEEMYYAMQKFFIINGYFTPKMDELELPKYVLDSNCAKLPNIHTSGSYSFIVTVFSSDNKLKGTIDESRLLVVTQQNK